MRRLDNAQHVEVLSCGSTGREAATATSESSLPAVHGQACTCQLSLCWDGKTLTLVALNVMSSTRQPLAGCLSRPPGSCT